MGWGGVEEGRKKHAAIVVVVVVVIVTVDNVDNSLQWLLLLCVAATAVVVAVVIIIRSYGSYCCVCCRWPVVVAISSYSLLVLFCVTFGTIQNPPKNKTNLHPYTLSQSLALFLTSIPHCFKVKARNRSTHGIGYSFLLMLLLPLLSP